MTVKEPIYCSGDKYGFLTLTGKSYINTDYGNGHRRFVEVICECGKIYFTYLASLRFRGVKSCGCKRKALIAEAGIKHGMCTTPIYKVWAGAKGRCQTETHGSHKNYGGRGIAFFDGWKDFKNFYDWAIVNGWQEGLTIERVNNNGNYEPANCRWVTMAVQNRNKRTNRFLTAFGETKCFEDWVKDIRCKVAHATLFYRLSKNWDVESAISTPPTHIKIKINKNG